MLESGYGDTPFSEDDECNGLTDDECRDIKNAVDVTTYMALLDCTLEDMRQVISELADLLDGIRTVVEHTCRNGNRIEIGLNGDGELEIKTEPPLEE